MPYGNEDLVRDLAYTLSFTTACTGIAPIAARGVWLAAKLGKTTLVSREPIYADPPSVVELFEAGLGIAAAGLAHPRLRAEAGKALKYSAAVDEDDPYLDAYAHLRRGLSNTYERFCEQGERSSLDIHAVAEQILKDAGMSPDEVKDLPADLRLAFAMQVPFPLVADKDPGFFVLLELLPSLVDVEAEQFFVPRSELPPEVPWDPKLGVSFVEQRRETERYRLKHHLSKLPPPVIVAGRNEPCPCGSGKKFKRCCAG